MDTYSEELAFQNIFMDSSRPENYEVKIQYSEIVKTGLRRSDRRMATCVDSIMFFPAQESSNARSNRPGKCDSL
jgi:hypothetical protein